MFVVSEGFELANSEPTQKGTATYTGSAVGKYALRDDPALGTAISGDGVPEAGAFTATAALTAKFATTTTLSGAITGFMTDDGADRDWTVELASTTLTSAGFVGNTATEGTTAGSMPIWKASDGDPAAREAGEWHANFYRDANAAATPGVTDDTPTHVGGTFSAEYGSVGRMVGAFGAKRQ